MRRIVLWTFGILIAVVCVAAANLRRDPTRVEVDWQLFRPSPPSVVVGHPDRGPIARTIAAKGVVEPVRQSRVVSQVSGKVLEVLVEEGSSVRKGDILFKLDDASFRSRADSAKTRLDTARTNLEKAEAHLRDLEKDPVIASKTVATPAVNPLGNFPGVVSPPATSPTKLEAARSSVDGWKRERKSAEVADESARSDLDRTSIRATIDGLVEDLAIEVGDDVFSSPTVSVGANPLPVAPSGLMSPGFGIDRDAPRLDAPTGPARPLCLILDPEQLRVRAWIDEADVGLVVPDQPVLIFLPDEPTTPVKGRISKVAARGRPTGEVVAYAATIAFDDAKRRPKAGMRVNVEVEVSRQESLLGVPVQAVMHRKRRDLARSSSTRSEPKTEVSTASREGDSGYIKAVFVVDGDFVRLRPIETGLSDEHRVEVVSGLSPNDRIVVGPFRALDTLEDGTAVRPEGEVEDAVSLTQGPLPPGRRPAR